MSRICLILASLVIGLFSLNAIAQVVEEVTTTKQVTTTPNGTTTTVTTTPHTIITPLVAPEEVIPTENQITCYTLPAGFGSDNIWYPASKVCTYKNRTAWVAGYTKCLAWDSAGNCTQQLTVKGHTVNLD